ncbi:MAG: hypothetical protein WC378_13865 [Opitutaceae bacterium]|jgi:hypothetical protein
MIRRISLFAFLVAALILVLWPIFQHSRPTTLARVSSAIAKIERPSAVKDLIPAAPASTFVHTNPAAGYDWNLKTSPFLTLGGTATLNFGSRKVSFTVQAIDTRGANHFVITGRSVGNPNPAKDIIVTYKNGAMLASAHLPDGTYSIMPSYRAKGEWIVGKVEAPLSCGSCDHSTSPTTKATQTTLPSGVQAYVPPPVQSSDMDRAGFEVDPARFHTVSTTGPIIDVLLYLDQDLVDLLGTDQAALLVDLCEASFNCAAENSQMATRVHIPKTKIIPAPWKTLNNTTDPTLVVASGAITLRKGGFENIDSDTKLAAADLAFFLGAYNENNHASGLGSGEYAFDANGNATAFLAGSAVAQYFFFPGVLFTHELGHMLGLLHERSIESTILNPVRDYNYAWSEFGGEWNAPHGVATIMSGLGNDLLYFSNPNVTYTEHWYSGGLNGDEDNPANWSSMSHQMGRPIGTADAAYDAKYLDEAIAPYVSTINPSLLPTTAAGHYVALSTRGIIGNGDNAMIGGFIISGTTPKKVMVRALGPSLASQGVTGVATNPKLALFHFLNPTWETVTQNDDWVNDPNQAELGASQYRPVSFVEPGFIVTLAPGPYTAVIQPQDGVQGVGMVEVYEMPGTGDAKVVDVATRALVGVGNNGLFAGFIIDCPAGQIKSVLLRGIGPSLAAQGVPNALQDPTFRVYNMNVFPAVVIATSDDWVTEATAARVANQSYVPSSPREAATVIDLPAGIYTVILEPKNGVPGIGMVEVYELPDTTPSPLISLPNGTTQ